MSSCHGMLSARLIQRVIAFPTAGVSAVLWPERSQWKLRCTLRMILTIGVMPTCTRINVQLSRDAFRTSHPAGYRLPDRWRECGAVAGALTVEAQMHSSDDFDHRRYANLYSNQCPAVTGCFPHVSSSGLSPSRPLA